MNYNDSNAKLHYEDQGEGQTVIFVHGVMMSSKFFHKQVPYFSENYRTITVDLRGHGQSSKAAYGHTLARYAKDLKRFIEKTSFWLAGQWALSCYGIM